MSDALEKKITTLFHRFDADSSGTIEESDFDKWSDRLIALGNISADQGAKLRENLKSMWNAYFAPADNDKDGKITCAELISYFKQTIGDESKKATLRETLPLIFDAIDSDKSGCISQTEFSNYFKSLNINDEKVIHEVFASMDTNSDKSISKDEFIAFGREFFSNQGQDSSKLFFGPLVN